VSPTGGPRPIGRRGGRCVPVAVVRWGGGVPTLRRRRPSEWPPQAALTRAHAQRRRGAPTGGGEDHRQRGAGLGVPQPRPGAVAAPAGQPPPRQSHATADATAAGRKHSRGFGHRPHGHASGRRGDGGGSSGGRARWLGRHQPVGGARRPPSTTAPTSAARLAVVATAPPPPPRPRPVTMGNTSAAAAAATAATTAAAAAAAAARRCVWVRVARAVVDRPPPARRQARRQRRQRRWPPPHPPRAGVPRVARGARLCGREKKRAGGLARGARPVGARTWEPPTDRVQGRRPAPVKNSNICLRAHKRIFF